MRTATLVADNTAPIRLTEEQSRKISNHPKVRRLRARCQQLTLQICQLGFTVKEAQHDELGLSLDEEEDTEAKGICKEALKIGRQKKEADAELNRTLTKLREPALEKNRKRHFRNTDTEIFNRQYEAQPCDEESEQQNIQPNRYFIPEREEIVQLLCYSPAPRIDEEAHLRRLDFIRLMVRWQRRKESPRRGKQASAVNSQPEWETTTRETAPANIAEKYHPLQCPFCLSDRSLPPIDREKKKSKRNKLWDHVETMHKLELAAFDDGINPCGLCDMRKVHFVPPSVHTSKTIPRRSMESGFALDMCLHYTHYHQQASSSGIPAFLIS
ncbi:hypothetical protein ASPCAL14853 [Aspergillus calidoustus]|uniref:Uncharacterized protein n=1 Tax=Aspergillus calidoustus TaxID=454130 RepID=A0A0U5CKG0_ASPCI|nr:hypothetical protein ASPCAL14853 [Aspergillus calidoustus]